MATAIQIQAVIALTTAAQPDPPMARIRTMRALTIVATLQPMALMAMAPTATAPIAESPPAMARLAVVLTVATRMAAAAHMRMVRMKAVAHTVTAPTAATARMAATAHTKIAPMGTMALTAAPTITETMGIITVVMAPTLPVLDTPRPTTTPTLLVRAATIPTRQPLRQVMPVGHPTLRPLAHPPTRLQPMRRRQARIHLPRALRPLITALRELQAQVGPPQILVQSLRTGLARLTRLPPLAPLPRTCPDLHRTLPGLLDMLPPQPTPVGRTRQCQVLRADHQAQLAPHHLAPAQLPAARSLTLSRHLAPASLIHLAR